MPALEDITAEEVQSSILSLFPNSRVYSRKDGSLQIRLIEHKRTIMGYFNVSPSNGQITYSPQLEHRAKRLRNYLNRQYAERGIEFTVAPIPQAGK